MRALINDIKYAFRQLRKNPGFTSIAILSLALGIGANTAIFSLLNAILLRSLPVPRAEELRVIDFKAKGYSFSGYYGGDGSQVFPYSAYISFREQAQGFSDIFAFHGRYNITAVTPIGARTTHALLVTGNFFSGYGAQALIGRTIIEDDDRSNASPVAVITYRAWERYYQCDPNVLGQTVALNKAVFSIVGVLPSRYSAPIAGDPADFYVPLIVAQPKLQPGNLLTSHEHWWVQIMGRRTLGSSESQAHASITRLFSQFMETSRDTLQEPVINLRDARCGIGGQETAKPIWVLQALVALVLLIACANLASLLLARGASRRHELAVRAAIGAGRGILMRQALTESLLLSILGTGFGLLFAFWIKSGLLRFFTAREVGFNLAVHMDIRVMAFTLVVAVITTFLCGMVPAWLAGRVHPLAGLKDNRTQTAPHLRIGKVFIATQMALSVLLVLGSGLLIQTLINLHRVDPGFDVENLLTFRVSPGQAGYKGQNLTEFYRQTQEAISSIPGTRSVALSSRCLLSGGMEGGGFSIPGRNDLSQSHPQAHMLTVSDSFLETMGIGLLAGRNFYSSDSDANIRVVIANETFAHTFFPEGNALGQIIKRVRTEYLIVGLCRDAAYENLRQSVPPTLYFPYTQHMYGGMTFNVRSVVPPLSLVSTIRKRLAQIDRYIPLEEIATQEQVIQESLAMESLFTTLCGGLTFLALSLSCIGLYGLLAYNVARRTSEMGIRMAFGARPYDVAAPVLREAVVLAFIGIAIGMPITLAVTRLAQSAFFGINSYDPLTVGGSIVLLLTVALLAAWIPARRAAKIDPMEALRYE